MSEPMEFAEYHVEDGGGWRITVKEMDLAVFVIYADWSAKERAWKETKSVCLGGPEHARATARALARLADDMERRDTKGGDRE